MTIINSKKLIVIYKFQLTNVVNIHLKILVTIINFIIAIMKKYIFFTV